MSIHARMFSSSDLDIRVQTRVTKLLHVRSKQSGARATELSFVKSDGQYTLSHMNCKCQFISFIMKPGENLPVINRAVAFQHLKERVRR